MTLLFHTGLISALHSKPSFKLMPVLSFNSIGFPHFGRKYEEVIKPYFMHHSNTAFFPNTGNKAKNLLEYSSYFCMHSFKLILTASLDILVIFCTLCGERKK
ncbi:UNVERIFIED_CONTAM: hypothetical protein NCL1_53649 [Trichonephila clavipes]